MSHESSISEEPEVGVLRFERLVLTIQVDGEVTQQDHHDEQYDIKTARSLGAPCIYLPRVMMSLKVRLCCLQAMMPAL